ncbi:MAG: 23S rRNA (uracil(1939)-C(5))-methyltransferase RlmD [Tissierellia bacterium]|nr:23S rRNA (uracil(1939)-C(5))-methyltransferase RlmD [Tissierellia bacterium]
MKNDKKKTVDVDITSTVFPNIGVGIAENGKEYQVKGALKGSNVEVKPGNKKRGIIQGKLVSVIKDSYLLTEKGCVHKDKCGGCSYQGMDAEVENQYKKEQVQALMEAQGIKLEEWELVGSPQVETYRNKMEYTFGDEYKGGPLSLGLHQRGRYHDILPTPNCLIVHEDMNKVREAIMEFASDSGLPHYHRMSHEGFYRHAVIRRSHSTGDILVNLVTTTKGMLDVESLLEKLLTTALEGKVRGVLHTENDALSDAIIPQNVKIIYGEDRLEEVLHGIEFSLSSYAFFQTNTESAEVLYGIVGDWAGKGNHELILDLYSGTGTMAMLMADRAKKVLGIEIVEDAVKRAKETAEKNGLSHVEFICGDVKDVVAQLDEKPGLAIVDPPREGMHPKALEWLASSGINQIIMVSCNPKTMARDLAVMQDVGYEIKNFIGVNQFPRTVHVECVALLSRE